MDKSKALNSRSDNTTLKVFTRVICITIIVIGILLSLLAWFFTYCEYNPLDFVAGSRIHAVRPRVYDAHYNSGTLVLVKPAEIRALEKDDIISMVYNDEAPFIFNNERLVEFQEEYFGISLHGIVTERTVDRERSPLRGGYFVGVPYGSIPVLGTILIWIDDNLTAFYIITLSLLALSVLAIILVNRGSDSRKALLPKPKKRR